MYYRPPLDDIRFVLRAFDYEGTVSSMPGFEDFDLDTAMDLLEGYSRFCVDVLQPLNAKGDAEGVRFVPETHEVFLPDGFKEAWAGYCENGFTSLPFDPEYGGLGAPFTLSTLASEILIATNKSLSMCAGLTTGLLDALEAHASEPLKQRFMEKLVSGEWAGTMCLTEPHCGTDLGLLTTRAEPYGDHYKLTGTKTWITFGEHDLTDNIVHLVLARLPGAPSGTRGISTFVVPKYLEDGTRNPVFCGGTDHKMGIHASPTCVMNFEGAEGWLVGEENRGMVSMFTMMNAARLNVGIEGVALAEAAYQAALEFARDRRQGRSLDPAKQDPDHPADIILVHPDVRRMLLEIKATNEALRGLVGWMSMHYDIMHRHPDEATRAKAGDLVALLTPIIKSYGSERGFYNISQAMQVMGGAGYTRDWPVEQYMRDERIAMIYEGTNHVQALDLVGRKLPMGGGRLMRGFAAEITEVIRRNADSELLAPFIAALKTESKRLNETTMAMSAEAMKDHELIGAVASNYLNQFALVTLAYVWVRELEAVVDLPEDDRLRRGKLQTARYFFDLVLPEAAMYAEKVAAGKAAMTEFDAELF
ncbi:MAG: acyl-CoA dehydrogenase [Deltaproteobacteria bacterium]|nr:MAG: acyl-CoA dehydrogenase [Deltaproteobacteria bacterium]